MSVVETLFDALESNFPKNYTGSFNAIDPQDEKTYAIYLRGGAPSYRDRTTGKYGARATNIVLNIQSSKGSEGVREGLSFCENVQDILSTLKSFTYTSWETGHTVTIHFVTLTSDIFSVGFNKFGIACFSINFTIYYGGGKINDQS